MVALGTGVGDRRRHWLRSKSSADAFSRYMTSYVRSPVGLKPTWKTDDLLVLNDDDVADLVRAAVKREGSQAAFAKRYGIDRTDLSAFLNGRRGISASLAKAFRIRRVWVVEYEATNES
jgi:hypothetical protein